MDVVTRPGEGLFPAPAEIHLDCSCPDWAVMCKHVAGALYGVGARLDSEPEMLFSLRGVDPAEMIADAVGGGATHRKKARGRVLEDDVLSSVFGVDIDLGGEALTGETKPKHRRRTKDVSEVKAPPSKKLRPSTPKSSAIASPTSEASGRLDPTAAADQVLAVITGEPDLRTPQIAERVGAPRSVIKKAIRELKRRGLVGFVGASRTGGYRLAERASDDETGPGDVESAVVGFHRASLAGEYFESFGVNSKNHREWSAGTRRWISRFNRLLERVSELAEEMDYAGARRCYALLFELLEGIDAHDDIVFFADEWGAWQVGVPWEDVLPIWLVCVAETAEPKEFATEVIALGRRRIIDGHAVDELLAEAGFVASDAQRSALDELCSEPPR